MQLFLFWFCIIIMQPFSVAFIPLALKNEEGKKPGKIHTWVFVQVKWGVDYVFCYLGSLLFWYNICIS